MNAMAPIEGLEGSGKPLFHLSSSVIADNARDGYASNHIFDLRMTARSRLTDKAYRAAIDQLVRDAAQRGIGSSSDLLLVKRYPVQC